MYDYLIVGAGLFGAVFAREATDAGKKCCVIDRRNHAGGNIYTEYSNGIHIHKYGAHIFHTSDEQIWKYVNRFVVFNDYINSPIADFNGERYNLPFNMNTFSQLWGIKNIENAKAKIESQRLKIEEPKNLEEQALSLVGREIYEKLIKGYTEKQWGRKCTELPASIIKRLPVRFTFDNNYFNDKYQGIPENGYTELIEKLLDGAEVRYETPYKKDEIAAGKIIYTGAIDEYFDYKLGALEYRSLKFEEKIFDRENVQGNAVINYTSADIPYTRTIEHRHFDKNAKSSKSIVTTEYPMAWKVGTEPYYPINDDKNNSLYERYKKLSENEENVIFGGRLGNYKYYDMDKVIESAIETVRKEVV